MINRSLSDFLRSNFFVANGYLDFHYGMDN